MDRRVFVIFIITSISFVSAVEAIEICSLVSQTEMAAAIGKAIASVEPMGPLQEHKLEIEAVGWNCLYNQGEAVVTVIGFPSAGAAKKYLIPENVRKELQDLEIDVVEEKGLGERAFIFTQENGWTVSLLKGSKQLSFTVSGALASSSQVRTSLRQLAAKTAGRL